MPFRIFVGAPFFGLPCLGGKKGDWGWGQRPGIAVNSAG
jgi:hypothetical protein